MNHFIKINKRDRELLFNYSKLKCCKSYEELAQILKISRNVLFKYKNGTLMIPKNIFIQLKIYSEIKIKNFKETKKEKYEKKFPRIPRMVSKDVAEILGILNGDGHISPINNEICVVGNKKTEKKYFTYLKTKFEKIFRIKFKIEVHRSCIKIRTYSIILANWFASLGLPKGNKVGKLHIPITVSFDKGLLRAYMRGLFDTDGTIYIRRKKDLVIEISNADKVFLREIKNSMGDLGFKVGIGHYRVFIYKKDHIKKFFKEIKPANPQHLKRYKKYLSYAPVA